MTDIRQHLSLILNSIKRCVAQTPQKSLLLDELRAILPTSYGVDVGRVITMEGQVFAPFDLILYDKTIPQIETYDDPSLFSLRAVLAVALLAHTPTYVEIEELFANIATVKQLHTLIQEKKWRAAVNILL